MTVFKQGGVQSSLNCGGNTSFKNHPDYGSGKPDEFYLREGDYIDGEPAVLWPNGRLVFGSPCETTYGPIVDYRLKDIENAGSRSTYTIEGQCVDLNGLPVGPCTVECFSAADNVFRGTTVSDTAGNYSAPTDIWGVPHYVVSNTQDGLKAGVSRQDLMPI